MRHWFLTAIALLAPAFAEARDGFASDWVDLREARIRLVMAPVTGDRLEAGLEIALAPGYKTYWRNAGDSGIPPVFDFSRSESLRDIAAGFPFPEHFDDGAGGKAIGYKTGVLFPIAAKIAGSAPLLHLKLDFAVCGTMCIPLSGEVRLDPAKARPFGAEGLPLLHAQHQALPNPISDNAGVAIIRIANSSPARWRIRFPYSGDLGRFSAFAEAKSFSEVTSTDHRSDNTTHLVVSVDKAAGAETYGSLRLTYGNRDQSYERMFDLDAAPVEP